MELFIKNMVCPRCIVVVEQILRELGISFESVSLGVVELTEVLAEGLLEELDGKLQSVGFAVINGRNEILVEKVKNLIIQTIHNAEGIHIRENFSHLISKATATDYHTISAIFKASEGLTIEKYIILQRIERAKELLAYDERNLAEIAVMLGYSSPQHLSAQFKKVTGVTATAYRKAGKVARMTLDSL